MRSTDTDIAATIRDFVEQRLLHGDGTRVELDAPLIALGILDSASVVMLAAFVEETFEVAVPDDLELRELETIADIERLVRRLAGG